MTLENMGDLARQYSAHIEKMLREKEWCPKCRFPIYDGRCENCEEVEKIEKARQLEELHYNVRRLGGNKAYEDYTEEKFDCKYYDGKKAIQVCSNFPNENLYIWGDRGVGKTHLGVILIRKHPRGKLVKPYEVLRELRCLVLDSEAERAAIKRYIDHPCIMLDDLGTEKLTEHAASLLYEIIDGRDMDKRRGLLITSNYSLGELATKMNDDRVPSRLAGMCRVIRLTGKDRRPEKEGVNGH